MGIISILIYIVVGLPLFVYLYQKWKYSYWTSRNVFHLEPKFPYGSAQTEVKLNGAMTTIVEDLYHKVKERGLKYGGYFEFLKPMFVPVDLELVRCIMQKDFSHFTNHGTYVNEEVDPLSGHLFNLEDDKWKSMRTKLTPTFTSGKMKMMFQTMVECTEGLQELLKKSAASKEPVDIKNILSCFTTDVIGSVAFGLDINSMQNPDSDFRSYGNRIFEHTPLVRLKFIFMSIWPQWLIKKSKVKLFSKDLEDFYMNLINDTVTYREKNNITRKDFLQLLIELKNSGRIRDDEDHSTNHKVQGNAQGMTISEMAAQCFAFYAAGFETSATTMTFALLELSLRPDIQEQLREQILKAYKKEGNKVTYDSIMEMELLEKVISETLRKHPPAGILPRICNKTYKVPDSDLVIEAGTRINLPIYAIHRDPDYYPDPDTFDPERFSEENKANRTPFSYMPFGEGPRTCIGMRFGKQQAKVGLCCVLRNYRVTLNEKTKLPITYRSGFVSAVEGGLWVNLIPLEK